MMTAAVVRTLLIVDMVGMALLALVYLRQRRMSSVSFFCWGVVALMVPVLGPFLLIANRPGQWDPDFSIRMDFKRLAFMVRRILPEDPRVEKKYRKQTMADRVRTRRRSHEQKAPR